MDGTTGWESAQKAHICVHVSVAANTFLSTTPPFPCLSTDGRASDGGGGGWRIELERGLMQHILTTNLAGMRRGAKFLLPTLTDGQTENSIFSAYGETHEKGKFKKLLKPSSSEVRTCIGFEKSLELLLLGTTFF